jgi:hypothetical protein
MTTVEVRNAGPDEASASIAAGGISMATNSSANAAGRDGEGADMWFARVAANVKLHRASQWHRTDYRIVMKLL